MEDGPVALGADGAADVEGVVTTVSPAPRFLLVPERARSLGPDVVAFAERVGIPLDEHQRLVLDVTMGVDEQGRWASTECVDVEPRQNGKSSGGVSRALWGVFENGERHVLYSGHMWQSTNEAFLFANDVVQSNPELLERCEKIRYSASDLGFTLHGGARLRFVTRSRAAARSFSGECVIFDEAGWLSEATHSSIVPTLSAKSAAGSVQVFYFASAVDQTRHPDGAVLASIRRRGIAGEDPDLAYIEWSAEVLDSDGREVAPDQVPDDVAADPEVWRMANPAIPSRIAERHVAWELRSLDRRSFSVERLGVGDWPAEVGSGGPINVDDWLALCDPASKIDGPICVGFDVGPNRQSSIAIGGLREDKFLHLEISDTRLTTAALVARIVQLVNDHDPWKVVLDSYGIAGTVADQIEEQGVEVHRVTTGEHAAAVALLREEIVEGTVRHLGSSELLEAIKGASTRAVGDAHLWSRRHSSVDISPLVSASLCAWAARGMPDPEWEPFVY